MHCFRRTIAAWPLAALALAACASAPHVSAYQQAPIAAPRTLALALDRDEQLPFGIARAEVLRAAEAAGFDIGTGIKARYQLFLTAAAGSANATSFLPAGEVRRPPDWVARADRSWRGRAAGGEVTRVTAVLVDAVENREVWRGTGTARTSDSAVAARDLANDLLARLPRNELSR